MPIDKSFCEHSVHCMVTYIRLFFTRYFNSLSTSSKFIVPGSVRVGSKTDRQNLVEHLAFRLPDGNMAAVVLNRYNQGANGGGGTIISS